MDILKTEKLMNSELKEINKIGWMIYEDELDIDYLIDLLIELDNEYHDEINKAFNDGIEYVRY